MMPWQESWIGWNCSCVILIVSTWMENKLTFKLKTFSNQRDLCACYQVLNRKAIQIKRQITCAKAYFAGAQKSFYRGSASSFAWSMNEHGMNRKWTKVSIYIFYRFCLSFSHQSLFVSYSRTLLVELNTFRFHGKLRCKFRATVKSWASLQLSCLDESQRDVTYEVTKWRKYWIEKYWIYQHCPHIDHAISIFDNLKLQSTLYTLAASHES